MKPIHIETTHHVQIDPFQMLGIEIIRQAAEDYRKLLKRRHESNDQTEMKLLDHEIVNIRHFFYSDWFSTLSGLESGTEILMRLDEEALDND